MSRMRKDNSVSIYDTMPDIGSLKSRAQHSQQWSDLLKRTPSNNVQSFFMAAFRQIEKDALCEIQKPQEKPKISLDGYEKLQSDLADKIRGSDLDLLLKNKLNSYLSTFEINDLMTSKSIIERRKENDPKFAQLNKKLNRIESRILEEQIILSK